VPPPSETEADDAAFPSFVASYYPRTIFQVRASRELAWRSTRKGVVRGAASGRDGEAFSILVGEGSEADRLEGRSKRQKEKEERAGRRIRQRPTRLARPRVDAHIEVRPSSREIRLKEKTNQSSEPARRWDQERGPCETDDVTRAEFRRLGDPTGRGEDRER
jgi:hypothetical protein